MDDLTVILITSASALLTAMITAFMSSRLTNFRLERLEKKMDLHNNYMHRLAVLEEKASSVNQRIELLFKTITSCKHYEKEDC